MKTIIRYALKNISFFKAKSIAMALVCFVCAAFFTYEALSLQSFKLENDTALDNTFGVHDGIFACDTDTLYRIKNDPAFSDVGTVSVLFHAIRNENFADRNIVIGTADKGAVKLQRIRLLDGKFPENKNELALEQTLADILFPEVKLGDRLSLEITLPTRSVREFTLCGILSDFSNLQWDPQNRSAPMVNALTFGSDESVLYSLVSVVGEPGEYGAVYYPNRRDNYDTLKAVSGVSSDVSVAIIIGVLTLFTVASMIISAYALNTGGKRAIGLMKTAGFTKRTVLIFFAVKSALIFLPSAVIGTAVGAIMTAVSGNKMPDGALAMAAVCCAAVILVLLSATVFFARRECKKTVTENLYQSPRGNYERNVGFTSESPIVLYSVKNFLLNGKETAVPCVMVFLSSLLLFLTLSLSEKMESELEKMRKPYDVGLSFSDQTVTSVNVSRYPRDGLSDSEFDALCSHENVEYALGCKRLYAYELFEDTPYRSTGEHGEDYETDKSRLGFPDCALSENRLCGLDDNSLRLLQSYVNEGIIDTDVLSGGKSVVWVGSGHSVGDVIKLAYVINRNPEHPAFDDLKYCETEVMISAVVDIPRDSADETALMLRECLSGSLIWSERSFEQIGTEKHYDSVFLKTADEYGTLFTLIWDMKMHYGERFIVSDRLGEQKSFESFKNAFFSIACILTGGLTAFSIASLSLVTAAKYAGRKKLFGFLRAAGLTKRQMLSLVILENIPTVFAAFALGIICGAVTALIMGIPASGFVALLSAALLYLAAIVLIAVFAVRRNFGYSVVDCIRCE